MKQFDRTEDDEVLNIDLHAMGHIVKQHARWIGLLTVTSLLMSSLYAFFLHEEKYQSRAVMLLKPIEVNSVITNIDYKDHFFKGARGIIDPFKNQETLLSSRYMSERVFHDLQEKGHAPSVKSPNDLTSDVFSVGHIRGTGFLNINVNWRHPQEAQHIANSYVRTYMSLAEDMSHEPLMKQIGILTKEVERYEGKLAEVNTAIQQYKDKHEIVDLAMESRIRMERYTGLKQTYNAGEATVAANTAEIDKLKSQLQLDTTMALESVAKGQNEALTGLMSQLQNAEEKYSELALTYSPTNPDLVRLAEKMAVLRGQINEQMVLTIGHEAEDVSKGKHPLGSRVHMGKHPVIIRDDVRRDLVERLAKLEASQVALKKQQATRKRQIDAETSQLNKIPVHQMTEDQLRWKKDGLEKTLKPLKHKLTDLKIQNDSIQKALHVVDKPSLPKQPLFPSRLDLIFFATLFTAVCSALGILVAVYVFKRPARPHFVEDRYSLPSLGILPWTGKKGWSLRRAQQRFEKTKSSANEFFKAYNTLYGRLKSYGSKQGKKSFAFMAATHSSQQGALVANISLYAASQGQRVAVIDANDDVALSSLASGQTSIGQMVDVLKGHLQQNPQATQQELTPMVLGCLEASGQHENILYVDGSALKRYVAGSLEHKIAQVIMTILEAELDMVLMDAPPALNGFAPPRAGLVVSVESKDTEKDVETALRTLHNNEQDIVGCVFRDLAENLS